MVRMTATMTVMERNENTGVNARTAVIVVCSY